MSRYQHACMLLGVTCFGVALLVVGAVSSGALAGFTATVSNDSDAASAGALAFEHVYQSTNCALSGASETSVQCTGSIAPTAATPATGTVSAADAITDSGTVSASDLEEQASAASCGVADLANQPDSSNVMLPRYGTTFATTGGPMSGAGSITLDGSSGYASDVVSQTQPNPLISLGATYALGIWFRTSSSTGGPLFEIADSPTNTAGGDDRVLYMTSAGKLSFIQSTAGTTTTTPASYNDGAWHFVYITMSAVNIVLGVETVTTIYVDGAEVATGGGLLTSYVADAGYWHLGWAPASVTGVSTYFTGSLSDFVVFDTTPAPAAPSASALASQTAWAAWAAGASELWPLNDSGTTTFTGSLPQIGSTSPCTMIDLTWGLTNPTSCAAAPNSAVGACSTSSTLAAFANGAWQTLAAPGPGQTQTSTITTSRASTYNAYISGLHLYVPLAFRVLAAAGTWSETFSWSSAASAFIA